MNCADAPFSASFIAHHALAAQRIRERVPFQSYWTFSDIFEEQGQQAPEFSQAFGVRSINGIAKPVYRAMQLVKRLGDSSFPVVLRACSTVFNCTANLTVTTSSSAFATARANGPQYEALLVNHPTGPSKQPDDSTSGLTVAEINAAHVRGDRSVNLPGDEVAVTIIFTNSQMPSSVTVRRVDWNHSNALPVYHALGAPTYPNASAMAALEKASELVPELLAPETSPGVPGGWQVLLHMPAYSVASVSF